MNICCLLGSIVFPQKSAVNLNWDSFENDVSYFYFHGFLLVFAFEHFSYDVSACGSRCLCFLESTKFPGFVSYFFFNTFDKF